MVDLHPPGIAFQQAYLALVQQVRGHYPGAYILCANGPMLLATDFGIAQTYINAVITQLHAAGDARIAYLSFGVQGAGNGYACDWHPSAATHAIMATTLESALAQGLGW